MKKDYLRPEAEIIDIVTGNLMTTSNSDTEVPETDKDQPLDAGNHRGEWGNIWGDME